MKSQIPCGNWPSPITAEIVAGNSPRYAETYTQNYQGEEIRHFWLESRPSEKGRMAIMMHSGGKTQCILPAPLSCRSKVHEYGGGSYCIHNNTVYFVLADDQRIYRVDFTLPEFIPEPITESPHLRFADLTFDTHRQQIIAVAEDHSSAGEPENSIVAVPLHTSTPLHTLEKGYDFYAYPRLSPDGHKLCWISWNHPDMPWDNTDLWLAQINNDNTLSEKQSIPETRGNTSVFQPCWSPNNDLYFAADISTWWNIYRVKSNSSNIEPITQLDAEFATPLWIFRMQCFDFLDARTLLACYTQNGTWALAKINTHDRSLENIKFDCDSISSISAKEGTATFIAANAEQAPAVYTYTNNASKITGANITLDQGHISQPQTIQFPTSRGDTAFAFYYPPTNLNAESEDKPPMIFICHGGPTGASDTALNLKIQYWTNRGFAVMDVNYRGSTGYGRTYREKLHYQWGEYDVEDMCNAANFAVEKGWASPEKLIIKGSSAGGYTVLASLCFRQTFKAGVCLYGIGDLETLVNDTHKFEARYLDKLIGDYRTQKDLYINRSPIHFVDNIQCPILVFQGLEDKVVPPNQAEKIVQAASNKNLPVAYVTFPDEGHGFRNPENIKIMLNTELSFYCQVFKLPHPEDLPKLYVRNLG